MEERAFSIIVLCSKNKNISVCLDYILAYMDSNDELIIVDDHSDEHIKNVLEIYRNRIDKLVLPDKKNNRPHNRNKGAAAAKHETLLFVDEDMIFLQNIFPVLRAYISHAHTVGVVANMEGIGFEPEQLDLILGLKGRSLLEYATQVGMPLGYPVPPDFRLTHSKEHLNGTRNWQFFFTGYCAIKKDAFISAGGFDEALSQWGAEDTDFAYRLSKIGKLQYLPEVYALHWPHQRNVFSQEVSNRRNMYRSLFKYRVFDFEYPLSFPVSESIWNALQRVFDEMRKYHLPELEKSENAHCIYGDVLSANFPEGQVTYFDKHRKRSKEAFVGLALPFSNGYFQKAFISEDIFLFPMSVTARILQEYSRIAHQVRLVKTPLTDRIVWDKQLIRLLYCSPPFYRQIYLSKDIKDFQFAEHETFYEVIPKNPILRNEKGAIHIHE